MIVIVLMALLGAQSAPPGTIVELAWLSGCWASSSATRQIREEWMPPAGGTMLGMSRTVSGDRTIEHEFLMIRVGQAGVLEYVARPSGQAETAFRLTRAGANEVVFENPTHDFPQRIHYTRVGDTLVAIISGPMNGKPREIRFGYERCR